MKLLLVLILFLNLNFKAQDCNYIEDTTKIVLKKQDNVEIIKNEIYSSFGDKNLITLAPYFADTLDLTLMKDTFIMGSKRLPQWKGLQFLINNVMNRIEYYFFTIDEMNFESYTCFWVNVDRRYFFYFFILNGKITKIVFQI
jgi:hypothetical protein